MARSLLGLFALVVVFSIACSALPDDEKDCSQGHDDDLFPGYIFTAAQRRHGALVLHFVVAFYGFTVIALVCEDYFLPSVQVICEVLNLPSDVAAATFMSMATSAPELFVNVVSTFIADSNMGVGTTMGSATFNVLGIASLSGLAATAPIQLQRPPVLRDSLLYVIAVAVATGVVWDGRVEWYEALLMVICSILYLIFMFSHRRLARWARSLLRSDSTMKLHPTISQDVGTDKNNISAIEAAVMPIDTPSISSSTEERQRMPKGIIRRTWWIVSRPVAVVLYCTVPDCNKPKMRKFFAVTFLMCIVWIAIAAYFVSWMMSVIGATLSIPDAVMGITFLAAGGSMPEGISSVIMARRGIGSMGISNGLGANTLNILMNLGMPWLIRIIITGKTLTSVLSHAVLYNCIALFGAIMALNLILLAARYKLSFTQGMITSVVYVIFIVFMVLMELDVLHIIGGPVCS